MTSTLTITLQGTTVSARRDCSYFEYTLRMTGEDLERDQEFRLSEFSTIQAFSIWFIVLWEWQMCVNHTLLF